MFYACGGLLKGHFLLTSGLHSPDYCEKFAVLERPSLTSIPCGEIAARFANDNIGVVIGAVTGGIILSFEVGRQLGVRAIFAEREAGQFVLRRGFKIREGERVLVVEDVITTGGSINEVLKIVTDSGGVPVGVGYLCDRSEGRFQPNVRAEALMTLDVKAYKPEDCPQCKEGIPLTERGSKHL